MALNKNAITVPFPVKGLDEHFAYGQQPAVVSSDALNVRPYDKTGRLRGAKRPGTTKAIAAAVNGSNHIQNINQVTMVSDPRVSVANESFVVNEDAFNRANAWVGGGGDWDTYAYTGAFGLGATSSLAFPEITSNKVAADEGPADTDNNGLAIFNVAAVTKKLMVSYKVRATVHYDATLSSAAVGGVVLLFRCPNQSDPSALTSGDYLYAGIVSDNDGTVSARIGYGSTTVVDKDITASYDFGQNLFLEVRVDGDDLSLWIDGTKIIEATDTTKNDSINFLCGFGIVAPSSSDTVWIDNWKVLGSFSSDNFNRANTAISDASDSLGSEWIGYDDGGDGGTDIGSELTGTADRLYYTITSNRATLTDNTSTAGSDTSHYIHQNIDVSSVNSYVLRCKFKTNTTFSTDLVTIGLGTRYDIGTPGNDTHVFCEIAIQKGSSTTLGTIFRTVLWQGNGVDATDTSLSSATDFLAADTEYTLEFRVNGDFFAVYIDDNLVLTGVTSHGAGNDGVGMVIGNGNSDSATTPDVIWMENFQYFAGGPAASNRITRLVTTTGGNIYYGKPGGTLSLAAGGTDVLHPTMIVRSQEYKQDLLLVDGQSYVRFDPALNTAAAWTASAGSLPGANEAKATLIARYRGRVVVSGVFDDPHNWFMTRVDDETDFQYVPSDPESPNKAIAGNNADAGQLGDIVTALVTFSDDFLIFGGANSVHVLRGDPVTDGQIDLITPQTGIVGGDAWAFDSDNTLYFVGSKGIYRMASQTSLPELMTLGRLDNIFRDIDFTQTYVKMEWDTEADGLHIYLTPVGSVDTIHWWWDKRTDGFWKEQLPANMGPTATHVFDGDGVDDRVVLLGTRSSYIVKYDKTILSDDGGAGSVQAIEAFVNFPPVISSSNLTSTKLIDVVPVLANLNDTQVDLHIKTGRTPEAAVAASARVVTTLSRGRGRHLRQAISGHSIILRLSNTSSDKTFAVESLDAVFKLAGRIKKRGA